MRLAAIWLALLALYAATAGIDAAGSSDYGASEARHLLGAESLVSDGDLNVADEYTARAYAEWRPAQLASHGERVAGRLYERGGVGYSVAIAPAYAIGGPLGVQLFMAAVAALGFVLAIGLARRLVSEPWATRGVLVVAISPPALAYAATVDPALLAGAALAGAALLALAARDAPRWGPTCGAALLLAVLPWLGVEFAIAGLPALAALLWWTWRRGRAAMTLVAAEIAGSSALMLVAINRSLYGGPTPYPTLEAATGAEGVGGYVDRLPRLAALWIDRDYGLVRWAPAVVLAFFAVWLLWRSRREHVARALPERRDAEAAAALLLAVCAAITAVAAFAAPTMFGDWFPGRHLAAGLPAAAALGAWGLRHAGRAGVALAALTVLSSAWLLAALWLGDADGWERPGVPAPWGPLERAFPHYSPGSAWADAVALALAVGLAALALREWRNHRRVALSGH